MSSPTPPVAEKKFRGQQARRLIPRPLRRWLLRITRWPPIGTVRFGGLRRVTPISRSWGGDRGVPIDRYYIETFLEQYASDIRGHVLEIGNDVYTRRFGRERVERNDVLHVDASNPEATIVADLTDCDQLPADVFDCIICTQTLHLIESVERAIENVARLLRPGGVALISMPGISQINRTEMDLWGDYWRFTTKSAERLFEKAFPEGSVSVVSYGNVLSSVAFLHGLATSELRTSELDYQDRDYQLVIGVRAEKRVS